MTKRSGARLSVSTWSLHRTLGNPPPYGPDGVPGAAHDGVSLLELPALVALAGIRTLEICHFHLPSRDPVYLAELRSALNDAGVELWSLLIDGGDISDAVNAARDTHWSEEWIDVAAALGATNSRVAAGRSAPSAEALERSKRSLRRLAAYARMQGVQLMTENWLALLSTPEAVLEILDALHGELALCVDFGNWTGPTKYEQLARIMPAAASCHAKCHFSGPDTPDREDFLRCLAMTRAVGFAGPYTLIYDGPSADEWRGLSLEKEMVKPYLHAVKEA